MTTKVIFRQFQGETLALFPDEIADTSPYHCSSYAHIGQHGAADPLLVIQRSRPAQPKETRELARELRRIGYKLDIRQRYQHSSVNTRREQMRSY